MERWTQLSDDPNAPAVSAARQQALQAIRSPVLIADRTAFLTSAVSGKRLLDVGVVAHTRAAIEDPGWLHGHLKRSAASCLGLDILPESVAFLQSQGYEVVLADLTQAPLDQKFDVIVAGEVMEHLGSPGPFMSNCASMLTEGGRLLVTVPNPWYLNVVLKNLRGSSLFIDSADHVVWYDANSIHELGQRGGLELLKWAGIAAASPSGLAGRLLFRSAPLLTRLGLAPELFAKSNLYEFKKRAS
jgi:2-polyprenyl-3-methyl-5-hydroxy-6-metoxy-1,4-benzoquinol methylase